MGLARADDREKIISAARGGRGRDAAAVQSDCYAEPAAIYRFIAGALPRGRTGVLAEPELPAARRSRSEHDRHSLTAHRRAGPRPAARRQIQFAAPISSPRRTVA